VNPYLRAMRLERWPRSIAIFVGTAAFFFIYRDSLTHVSLSAFLARAAVAYLLTWFISTANYVVNEIADVPFDIHHPTKRLRPLVRGEIKKIPFAFFGAGLTLAALLPAFLWFSRSFFISLFALLCAGFIYNLKPVRTKDIAFLDSISESMNNPIRFLIGWFAFAPASLRPPLSALVCWWSFGNFLMVAKRLSEFRFLKDKAADYRMSHKKYSKGSLVFGMAVSTAVFFLTYFYFARGYKLEYFFYASPALFLFFVFIFRKTLAEQEVMEEPEKLIKHPSFAIYAFILLVIYGLAFFLDAIGRY
jgi:decaprenyl-phosphate phosphoribosyltransferase